MFSLLLLSIHTHTLTPLSRTKCQKPPLPEHKGTLLSQIYWTSFSGISWYINFYFFGNLEFFSLKNMALRRKQAIFDGEERRKEKSALCFFFRSGRCRSCIGFRFVFFGFPPYIFLEGKKRRIWGAILVFRNRKNDLHITNLGLGEIGDKSAF